MQAIELMKELIKTSFLGYYPQNYIFKKPLTGCLIIGSFIFFFAVLYKPLDIHEGMRLSYVATMAVYSLAGTVAVYLCIQLLKLSEWFNNNKQWNLLKELTSILIVLTGLGIVIYFMAFFIEPPADRWNLDTFLDSCFHSYLIGIIPFGFFTVINHPGLQQKQPQTDKKSDLYKGEKVEIKSSLKKENLNFYTSQLIFAESDGNYVNFHLLSKGKIQRSTLRISISNLENQLTKYPEYFRVHRTFIVNLKQIEKKIGNKSGYQLKLKGINETIPVARKKIAEFEEHFKKQMN